MLLEASLDIFDGAKRSKTLELIYGVVLGAQRTIDRSLDETIEDETKRFFI